ncbi:hypothetical protein CY34DRAFT_446317 [Suillus luteus UH-Slu-Lm8-n1]|uniref:Uncharacterized protein n=1 Tax=Suillus luteus UH-Slu-Lm8-n1 TaxID=930992 RepID=A0A0C9ZJM4_9AGAM|nr:hypothetical protein CY34DRAFT_446317 [Suillus luteus UH-Slu-Lm8-n1]
MRKCILVVPGASDYYVTRCIDYVTRIPPCSLRSEKPTLSQLIRVHTRCTFVTGSSFALLWAPRHLIIIADFKIK